MTDVNEKLYDGKSKSAFLCNKGPNSQARTANGDLSSPSLELQVEFAMTDGGPGAQYCTVQFNVSKAPAGTETRAEVTWSVDGNNTRRLISVVDGAVISGVASAIAVTVTDQTISEAAAKTYNVSVSVAQGCRPSANQPPRYAPDLRYLSPVKVGGTSVIGPGAYMQLNGDSAVVTLTIPRTAGVIAVQLLAANIDGTPLDPGALYVEFSDGTAPRGIVGVTDDTGFIPVPPGANLMTFNNTSAKEQGIAVTFGIEG